MVRLAAAARLLLLAAAAVAASASDVTAPNDVTEALLESALKEADDFRLADALRDGGVGRLTQLVAGEWRPLTEAAPRVRRSPQQQQQQRQNKRRRKGGRRRGQRRRGRKGGRRRRPTTPAPEERIVSTRGPIVYATTAAATPVRTTTMVTAPTTTTTTTTTTPPTTTTTQRPNFHIAPPGTINHRPVVGLLTQSLPGKLNALVSDPELSSYIDSSYVKFLESSGARVVPVMADQSNHYYREMFRYLNGLLVPGGFSNLEDSGFAAAARALWKIANEYSDDYFPILGIGQGMELLARLADPRASFKDCPATNVASQLFIEPGGRVSRLLGGPQERVRTILSSQPATVTFHGRCLSPAALRAGQLGREFRLVATSRDRSGAPFVSAIEHERLPVYGVAFQPEKPQFEWSRDSSASNIPHTAEAILASQHIGNAFVAEVRKSLHRFPSPDLEEDYLIFNYEPEFTGVMGADFTSCYFFS